MAGSRANSASGASLGIAGKLILTLFFLVFLGMGSVFVWLILRDSVSEVQTWTWAKTPCEIIASNVHETGEREKPAGNFCFVVRYGYTFKGQQFISETYKRKAGSFEDYGKAARLAERFRPESRGICYVNRSAPAEAVLQRGNLLFPLVALFPMLFVAIGA